MQVHVVASEADNTFRTCPANLVPQTRNTSTLPPITPLAVQYHYPDTGNVPLVADMSSHILSPPVDVSRFGVIFGGAQKNMGPAGLTVVIVRDDLLDRALPVTPSMLDYKTHADNGSMFNTPPTYAIYIAGLVFEWLLEHGGLGELERNKSPKPAAL